MQFNTSSRHTKEKQVIRQKHGSVTSPALLGPTEKPSDQLTNRRTRGFNGKLGFPKQKCTLYVTMAL